MRNWIFYFLIIVTPLLFFTNLTRNPYYLQIVMVNIGIILLWLTYLYESIKKKKLTLYPTPLDKPLLIFLGIVLLSWLVAYIFPPALFTRNEIFKGFIGQLRCSMFSEGWRNILFVFINWGLLFWAMVYFVDSSKLRDKILYVSFFTATVASVYGILQYYGIELIWPNVLNPYGGRCVSTFGNPNFLSSFLITMLPILMIKYFLADKITVRLSYLLLNFVVFWALVCTLTRSSWLGLLVAGILILIGVYWRYRDLLFRNYTRIIVLLIIFAATFFFSPRSLVDGYHPTTLERITEIGGTTKGTYAPVHQRVLIWSCAWDMIKERPVLGKGWGLFELYYPFYQGKYLFNELFRPLRTHANNAHNEILEISSQTGIVGLGVFIWFWITFFLWSTRALKSQTDKQEGLLLLALISAIGGLIIDNIAGNVSVHFAVPAMFFWMVCGLIANRGINREKNPGKIVNLDSKLNTMLWIAMVIGVYIVTVNIRFFMAETHYFKGFKMVRQNNLEAAKIELETAHKFHRWEVNNNYELGNTYARVREHDKAINMYMESFRANLGYDEIYFNTGAVYAMIDKPEDAATFYRRALYINPLSLDAYSSLGNYYLRDIEHNREKAIKVFQRVISLDPNHKEGWNNLGFLYIKSGEPAKARECFIKALEIDPSFQLAQYNLRAAGGAMPSFTQNQVKNNFNAINAAIEKKDWNTALQLTKQMVSLNPMDLRFRLYLGNIYFSMGNINAAIPEYTKIVQSDMKNVPARTNLGMAYLEIKNYAAAKNMFLEVLKLDPNNAIAKDKLASMGR